LLIQKKEIMKKFLMVAIMMLSSTMMFAEAGDMNIGANVNYSLDSDYKNFGIGVKVQWEFADKLRAEPSFNYYFKKDYVSLWDININAHYLINLGKSGFNLYPIAGVCLIGATMDVGKYTGHIDSDSGISGSFTKTGTETKTKIGANLGAGIEYPLTDALKINAEFKYQLVEDYDRPIISAGISYAF